MSTEPQNLGKSVHIARGEQLSCRLLDLLICDDACLAARPGPQLDPTSGERALADRYAYWHTQEVGVFKLHACAQITVVVECRVLSHFMVEQFSHRLRRRIVADDQ